jgi:hypothetical protein
MSNLADLIGVSCELLDDDESLAVVDVTIEFVDEDPLFVYVEKIGQKLRFFDGGDVVFHMIARGVELEDRSDAEFITRLTTPEGVELNDAGELEIWAEADDAHAAFTRFVSALMAIVAWESTARPHVKMIGQRTKVVMGSG